MKKETEKKINKFIENVKKDKDQIKQAKQTKQAKIDFDSDINFKGNVIITGYYGFIGIYTTAKFINAGYRVFGIDKAPRNNYKDNLLSHLVQDDKLLIHLMSNNKTDLTTEAFNNLHQIADIYKIDCIVHLASDVGVRNVLKDPHKHLIDNLNISQRIDDFCAGWNIPLIFSSSSEVFGENEHIKANSNFSMKQSERSVYAAQKSTSELIFSTNNNYSSANIRFFNIFGYGQQTGSSVVETFMYRVLNDHPMIIDENSKRSFCYVEDAVNMLFTTFLLLENKNQMCKDTQNKAKLTFNIGSANDDNFISMYSLALIILKVYNNMFSSAKKPADHIISNFYTKNECFIGSRNIKETGFPNPESAETLSIEKGLLKYFEYEKLLNPKKEHLCLM